MLDSSQSSPVPPSGNTGEAPRQPITTGRTLHEMGFADILDTTFSLYRSNFWLFIGIVAMLHIPFELIRILIENSVAQRTPAQIFSGLLAFGKMFVVYPIVSGGLVFAVAQEYLGKQTTIGEAFSRVKFGTVVGANLLMLLAVLPAVLIFPLAIYLLVRWSLFCQCIVVEGYRAIDSLGRSRELIEGSWWRAFGIGALLFILVFLIEGIPIWGAKAIGGPSLPVMSNLLEGILEVVARPIEEIGTTLLYFDFRIRKEAFDIEMRAKNIHGEV